MRDVIASLPPERIVGALETGTMRVQGETLTPPQRRAIAAYLSTVRPAPAAAAGAPNGGPRCDAAAPLRPSANDWRAWGVTPANDRFQRQPGFTSAQVPRLTLKWAFGFEGENAAAANPTIVGERVFVGSGSGRVFALGVKDGCVHWTFKADGGVRAAITIGDAADAASHPTAYFGDLRGMLYSVDAVTGELRWKKKLDEHRAARISGSAVLYGGRLYVPLSSGEEGIGAIALYECCTFRGSIVALDPATGEQLWRTYMITEAPTPRAKNARGAQLWGPSGAAVWSAPTIDAATRSLYVATGDAYSLPAAPMTDSVVALDLESGAIKWATQVTAGTTVRSGGITTGMTTKIISNASSTSAQRASMTSTVASAAWPRPGRPPSMEATQRSVPKPRSTSVNIVAATSSAKRAPVIAIVSRSTSRSMPRVSSRVARP